MRGFERRLRHLETSFHFDPSGYPPGSEGWQKFWDAEVEKQFAGKKALRLSVEIVRSWLQRQPDGDPEGEYVGVSGTP